MSNQGLRSDASGGALVIFPGALGDFVCLLPALRRIRAHDGSVTVLCRHDLVALVHASGLGVALPIEGRWASWLFQRDPPPEAKTFFAAFDRIDSFSGGDCPEVIANLSRWRGAAARVHRFRPSQPIHLVEYHRQCLDVSAAEDPPLSLGASLSDEARARLSRLPRPLLLIHPGSGGRRKRWSRDGFARIAERWRSRSGVDGVFVLGPAEAEEVEWWRRREALVFDDLDVVTLGAWLGECSLYLGNDSGASHLAGAVGARGAALFGVSDPRWWRPRSPRIFVVEPRPWETWDEPASSAAVETVELGLLAAGSLP